jgi:predicted metalloprotease with PDZ domain
MTTLSYQVNLFDAARHLLLVTMTVEAASSASLPVSLEVSLPAWIPGSYLVRDFARNITQISAQNETAPKPVPLKLDKTDKHTWRLHTSKPARKISISILVYAWDLSVRGAHFDQTHCFFNGTSVFLRLHSYEHLPHRVTIVTEDAAQRDWKIATAMQNKSTKQPACLSDGEAAVYQSANYDELIDHPFEIGAFQYLRFKACGAAHHVAITGQASLDTDRLVSDLKKICEAQIRFFEPESAKPPFKEYWFLIMAVGDGYGGLEHRASTALICKRSDLPFDGLPALVEKTPHDGYKTLLGLASHEYFHSWNVKRIKPQAFEPYDLHRETYTRLLWIFEGFTSYYDDLFLVRAGLIDQPTYLRTLAATFSSVQKTPGRLRQSVADSSFDAWTKYYRQDENAPNAIVSYYTKGSLVALELDLTLRVRSETPKGKSKNLDDVMKALWKAYQSGVLLGEDDFANIVEKVTGVDVYLEIQRWAYGTQDIDWQPMLSEFGLELSWQSTGTQPTWLGGNVHATNSLGLTVKSALGHGPLANAGVSAGDVLIALNGIKADDSALASLLERSKPKDIVKVHAFRRDELMEFSIELEVAPKTDAKLTRIAKPTKTQSKRLSNWLECTTDLQTSQSN